jgi:hypothetical protein
MKKENFQYSKGKQDPYNFLKKVDALNNGPFFAIYNLQIMHCKDTVPKIQNKYS